MGLTKCLMVEKEGLPGLETAKPHRAFSRHGEAVGPIQEAGRPQGRPGKFSSASDRLFLSGVLASRARLRFTGCQAFWVPEERCVNCGSSPNQNPLDKVAGFQRCASLPLLQYVGSGDCRFGLTCVA